jgi:hypothetical protein
MNLFLIFEGLKSIIGASLLPGFTLMCRKTGPFLLPGNDKTED